MLVVGPEHARILGADAWSKEDLKRHLFETVRVPYRALTPDEGNGEGANLRSAKLSEPGLDDLIPQFPSVDEIQVVVAGGWAGRLSLAIPGWLGTKNGSHPITVPVRDVP